jgi:ParB family transcriptional regulator, chromosome partitioning protein
MNQPRRLGRGLEALLGQPLGGAPEIEQQFAEQPPVDQPPAEHHHFQASSEPVNGITYINVYDIVGNPFQPRRDFDESEIDALSQSIRDHGVIQPLVVRNVDGRFELIAGERRLRAAQKAGWAQVPCQVREADDRQVAEIAIVENLQRKDLNALEKAASFQQYLAMYGCTQEELAGRLAVDRSTVSNLIRLLELPHVVQQAVVTGVISAGHARALLPLGDEHRQMSFCDRIQSESLSVRAIEELVHEALHSGEEQTLAVVGADGEVRPAPKRTRSKQIASLEQELKAALGCKVQISQTAKGKGKIVIHFANHNEFDRIRGQITQAGMPQAQAG